VKILWVKAGGLIPPDTGGKIRSYNILRQLAKDNEVTFFSFYANHENDEHRSLGKIFRRVITIPLDVPPTRSIGGVFDYAWNLFSTEPYNLTRYCRPIVRDELRALLREESFDVILCDFLVAAGVIPWDVDLPKVVFTHNVEATIWRRHFEVASNLLWKALSWREWKRMEAAERKYLRKADQVLTVSDNDRNAFAAFLTPEKLTVIPTGADTDFFRPMPENEIPNSMVFVGSMDWLPNEDAMIYFVNEIFPLILEEMPDAVLYIVGRLPSSRLQSLASRHSQVNLTGRVEDVRPYFAKGSVNIVPIRIGGGTRIKIFEAMSMGKAVVSTTVGAEGLPLNDGEHLLLADDPASFARCTLTLLRNPSMRNNLGTAARGLIERKYSWTTVSAGFATVLQDVVKCRTRYNDSQKN
jgi:sugar transferase (PEP-CTERM/EpsH1 system associated)